MTDPALTEAQKQAVRDALAGPEVIEHIRDAVRAGKADHIHMVQHGFIGAAAALRATMSTAAPSPEGGR